MRLRKEQASFMLMSCIREYFFRPFLWVCTDLPPFQLSSFANPQIRKESIHYRSFGCCCRTTREDEAQEAKEDQSECTAMEAAYLHPLVSLSL